MATVITVQPSPSGSQPHQHHHHHQKPQHPTPRWPTLGVSERSIKPKPMIKDSSNATVAGASSGHCSREDTNSPASIVNNTAAPVTTTITNTPTTLPTASGSAVRSACDACRRRKIRCAVNEKIGKCYSCDFHREDCTYTPRNVGQRSPRQSQTQSSNSDHRPQSRPQSRPQAQSQPQKRQLELEPAQEMDGARPPPKLLRKASNPTSTAKQAPKQKPQSQPNAVAIPPPSSFNIRTSQFIGKTTPLEPLLLDFLPLDKENESHITNDLVKKISDDTFIKIADSTEYISEIMSISADSIEKLVTPYGPKLVEKYFQHVQPSFPVLMEDAFKESFRTRKNLNPLLLASVYVVSLKWLEPNSGIQRPDAAYLEGTAVRLLRESLLNPTVQTIQAGLLLSQMSTINTSALSAQIVTAGFELGLHQDCSNWNMPSWERGLRKRLAWALYAQDKWSSLVHGRPSHILDSNWTVKQLTENDFDAAYSEVFNVDDSDQPALFGPHQFAQLVFLTAILSDILDQFYTLKAAEQFRAADAYQTRLILEKAKPIQIRLKDWFSNLPAFLKMDSDSSSDHASCMNGGLHIAYFAAEISLHRCIIRSMVAAPVDRYLSHICRSAAKTRLISSMDFVNRLRPSHLRSFWPFASRTNFALIGSFGALLRATAPSKEESEFYKVRLDEFRWTLSVSAKSATFLEVAVEALDNANALLLNIPEKPVLGKLMEEEETAYPVSAPSQDHPYNSAGPGAAIVGVSQSAGPNYTFNSAPIMNSSQFLTLDEEDNDMEDADLDDEYLDGEDCIPNHDFGSAYANPSSYTPSLSQSHTPHSNGVSNIWNRTAMPQSNSLLHAQQQQLQQQSAGTGSAVMNQVSGLASPTTSTSSVLSGLQGVYAPH